MSLELVHSPTAAEMTTLAAQEWVRQLQTRNKAVPYGVALSGGRVAGILFNAISAEATRANLDWSDVHFFWADERCVPPGDPESNFAIAQRALFVPLGIPPTQIHGIHGEVDPAYAAAEAEAELCRIMPLGGNGQPVLDLVFLGMGEDGHIASLFPAEPGTFVEDSRVYRAVAASKPPPNRITIGYQALIEAKSVWVIASGEAKKEALNAAVKGEGELPIVRLVKKRLITRFFNDIAQNY